MKTRTCAKSVVAVAALTLAVLVPAVSASADDGGLSRARAGTAEFDRLGVARADGYAEFRDVNGVSCIDNPGVGGMGVHYVNGKLVGNPSIRAAHPEALVYEPEPDGLHLVALEYIVTQSAWLGAGHTGAPRLFGQTFELVPSPNRYGLPNFYELHAWIWKHNPSGMFNDWNPRVSCSDA